MEEYINKNENTISSSENYAEANFNNKTQDWEPKWIVITVLERKKDLRMDENGMLTAAMDEAVEIEVPENLTEEIYNGQIDPLNYTKEELRQMAIRKHYGQIIEMQKETLDSSNIEKFKNIFSEFNYAKDNNYSEEIEKTNRQR
ncbi:MAG: hypothetical protein IKF82_03855 [Bacilli bacterium]|nr:hypothetical protein [Bacilli bacterium]